MEEVNQTIWEALAAVQKEMPVIGKNKTNDFLKAKYADLEKIWEVARPIIEKHGFNVYHYGEGDKVVTVAHHKGGQEIKSFVTISQVDPQKKGAEVTYYRRYNLCMLFNIIVADEDKDATGTENTDDAKLELISEQLKLLNTTEELTAYYKQLGSPKDKAVLKLFTARKKSL